jgi:hypothetical protein
MYKLAAALLPDLLISTWGEKFNLESNESRVDLVGLVREDWILLYKQASFSALSANLHQ